MRLARHGDHVALSFGPDVDLVEAYAEAASKLAIKSALILQGIGMLRDPEIAYFRGKEGGYDTKRLTGTFELAGCQGNICMVGGKPFVHLHVTLGDAQHRAHAGHLVRGTVHIAHEGGLVTLPDPTFERVKSEDTGLMGLRVKG